MLRFNKNYGKIICGSLGSLFIITTLVFVYNRIKNHNLNWRQLIKPIYYFVNNNDKLIADIKKVTHYNTCIECSLTTDTIFVNCDIQKLTDSNYMSDIISEIYYKENNTDAPCTKMFELLIETNKLLMNLDYVIIVDKNFNIVLYAGNQSQLNPDFLSSNKLSYFNVKLDDKLLYDLTKYKLKTELISGFII
jgi:hypothetical protein